MVWGSRIARGLSGFGAASFMMRYVARTSVERSKQVDNFLGTCARHTEDSTYRPRDDGSHDEPDQRRHQRRRAPGSGPRVSTTLRPRPRTARRGRSTSTPARRSSASTTARRGQTSRASQAGAAAAAVGAAVPRSAPCGASTASAWTSSCTRCVSPGRRRTRRRCRSTYRRCREAVRGVVWVVRARGRRPKPHAVPARA